MLVCYEVGSVRCLSDFLLLFCRLIESKDYIEGQTLSTSGMKRLPFISFKCCARTLEFKMNIYCQARLSQTDQSYSKWLLVLC